MLRPFNLKNYNGYRLPTDGEWQYAASYKDGTNFTPWNYVSGGTVAYANSDEYKDNCKEVAWYGNYNGGDSDGHTHLVGGKKANDLDLYDMSGNVWELCWDWKGDYPSGSYSDYTGPSSGSMRVERGGRWGGTFMGLRVGYRSCDDPDDELNDLGFRVARRP